MTPQEQIKRLAKHEVEFCQKNEYESDDNVNFVYYSRDGVHGINIPFILLEYKEWLIENKILLTPGL